MTPLVTLAEANQHLRRDSADDDADVELKIFAASAAIFDYLRPYGTPYITQEDSAGNVLRDSNGYPIIARDSAGNPVGTEPMAKAATLLLLGELYKSREGMADGLNGLAAYGSLPQSVVMLLYPMRVPVIA